MVDRGRSQRTVQSESDIHGPVSDGWLSLIPGRPQFSDIVRLSASLRRWLWLLVLCVSPSGTRWRTRGIHARHGTNEWLNAISGTLALPGRRTPRAARCTDPTPHEPNTPVQPPPPNFKLQTISRPSVVQMLGFKRRVPSVEFRVSEARRLRWRKENTARPRTPHHGSRFTMQTRTSGRVVGPRTAGLRPSLPGHERASTTSAKMPRRTLAGRAQKCQSPR